MAPWYKENFTEELCIIAVLVIAITAIFILENESSNIISAIIGGLIGYLKGTKTNA